jgi:3-isopropylmalate/(R)-2-methylmalate dehydratase small subunit
MSFVIKATVAGVLGNDINTDIIFPARYLTLFAPEEVRAHLFEDVDPGLAPRIMEAASSGAGAAVAGGANFGCGSAREQGLTALKHAGAGMVVCKSFSRAFYRNGINNAVPLFIADCPEPMDGMVSPGDALEADFESGELRNLTSGARFACSPTPPFIIEVLRAGGIFTYYRQIKERS